MIIGSIILVLIAVLLIALAPAMWVLPIMALGVWRASLWLWPEKTCRRCSGSGNRKGLSTWVRRCGECGGTGRVTRIGAGSS